MLRQNMMKIIILIVAIIIFCIWQNNDITINRIDYSNIKIPSEFNGFTIAQVSDLHNKEFGKSQEPLLKKLTDIDPNIIVVTGDLIDRRKYDLEISMIFINGAMKIAPVYYVSGNHEAWSGEYENISKRLLSAGVQILDDNKVQIKRGSKTIEILGLSDPDFLTTDYMDGTNISGLEKQLDLLSNNSDFQILLCHRPELLELYANAKVDIVFAGHAHGGQFRIPFIGGLVAPDQGLLPKYTSGFHIQNETTMFVSRGLGNSIIPVRIFNRPEIVVVTLEKE